MDVLNLMIRAADAGFELDIVHGKLVILGPPNQEELAAEIGQHKSAVMDYLKKSPNCTSDDMANWNPHNGGPAVSQQAALPMFLEAGTICNCIVTEGEGE